MLRGLFDRILALAAAATLVVGAIGFTIDISMHSGSENWLLIMAGICGVIVVAAALLRLIAAMSGRDYAAFKAGFYRDHTVILGYGLRNALLADAWRATDPRQKQIVLDHDGSRVRPLIDEPRRLFFRADLAVPGSLAPAGVVRARLVVIGSGADERNLAIAQQVIDLRAAPPGGHPAKVLVTLDDAALADRCSNDSHITRLVNGDELYFLNTARLAARQLLARTPLIDLALAAGQPRVRLLFAGFSPAALEVIIQFLRVSPLASLMPFRIDVVTPDIGAATDLIIERVPNLRHMLDDAPASDDAPLAWAGKIRLHQGQPAMLSHASDLFLRLEEEGAFTAIVIAGEDAAGNIKTALSMRPWTAQRPAFAVPIYVQAGMPSPLKKLYLRYDGIRPKPANGPLAELRGTTNASEAIEPFGMLEELYTPEFLFGARESLAKRLHAAYRQKRLAALSRQDGTTRSDLPDWSELDETYRQANRRAVDLVPAVRLAAGVPQWWEQGGLPDWVLRDDVVLEKLARLAHASWRIDRELDGWRPGEVRDVAKRLHTDLVDYDALSEEKKELDREQIRLLTNLQSDEARR